MFVTLVTQQELEREVSNASIPAATRLEMIDNSNSTGASTTNTARDFPRGSGQIKRNLTTSEAGNIPYHHSCSPKKPTRPRYLITLNAM